MIKDAFKSYKPRTIIITSPAKTIATSSKSLTYHDNDHDDNSNLRVTRARQATIKGKEKGTISTTADNYQDEYDKLNELNEEGYYDD